MKKFAPKLIIGCMVTLLLVAGSSAATARSLISTLAQGISSSDGTPSELRGRATTGRTSTGGRGTRGDGNTGGTSTGNRTATGDGNTGGRTIDSQTQIVGTRGAISK